MDNYKVGLYCELPRLSFRDQNEFWRGGPGKRFGSKPHNCQEYWALKEYLESTGAPTEITETLEQFAYFVDTRLSFYAEKLHTQNLRPLFPPKPKLPRVRR